jgi:hypothetical protein
MFLASIDAVQLRYRRGYYAYPHEPLEDAQENLVNRAGRQVPLRLKAADHEQLKQYGPLLNINVDLKKTAIASASFCVIPKPAPLGLLPFPSADHALPVVDCDPIRTSMAIPASWKAGPIFWRFPLPLLVE